MATHTARFEFRDDGGLSIRGQLGVPDLVDELSRRLDLFLARMDSCDRSQAGDFLLADRRTGPSRGTKVLWENVLLLTSAGLGALSPALSPEEHAEATTKGFVVRNGSVDYARGSLPLVDVLRRLKFSILANETSEWTGVIPAPAIARVRSLRAELELHRTASDRRGEPKEARETPAGTALREPAVDQGRFAEQHCGGDPRYPTEEWILFQAAVSELAVPETTLQRWVKELPEAQRGDTEPVKRIVIRRDALPGLKALRDSKKRRK